VQPAAFGEESYQCSSLTLFVASEAVDRVAMLQGAGAISDAAAVNI
jgi:hypothetical protein